MSIVILGDSSSSQIGSSEVVYSYDLRGYIKKKYNKDLYNFAVPGFTSSDASVFYRKILSKHKIDVLIIYLGNNEYSISPKKGRDNFSRSVATWINRKTTDNRRSKCREADFYRHPTNLELSVAVNKSEDYIFNLNKLISLARKKSTKVIVVVPKASRYYPPGGGHMGTVLFRFVNQPYSVVNKINSDIESDIYSSIFHHENSDFDLAKRKYDTYINRAKNSTDKQLLLNNKAVLLYENGYIQESISIFKTTLSIDSLYKSLPSYNLALVYKYYDIAYESDIFLYRIKDEYKSALISYCHNNSISYVVLDEFLSESNFVDYCHPDKVGHKLIFESLKNIIDNNKMLIPSSNNNLINYGLSKINPPSSNYFNDRLENMYDSYNALYVGNIELLKDEIDLLLQKKNILFNSNKTKCSLFIFNKLSFHPLFNKYIGFCDNDFYLHEGGAFPENYLYRVFIKYLTLMEKEYPSILDKYKSILGNVSLYKKMIVNNDVKFINNYKVNTSKYYFREIVEQLILFIESSSIFYNERYFRKRIVMHWYTRESFRYGTHSRQSMLYSLIDFDTIVEAVFVLNYLILYNKFLYKREIISKVIYCLVELKNIHESYDNISEDLFKHKLLSNKNNLIGLIREIK
jgi:lysophospholipase L1-like esterase